MQINKIIGEVKDKNILLLQGPMGSYFNTLDKRFSNDGANTYRIGFNAGDEYFAQANHYTGYKDVKENWNNFIYEYFIKYKINKLFVFGDCRFYQSTAIKVAKENNIEIYVFEEGYIRPNFITLEKHGVNANSIQPKNREFYDNLDLKEFPLHAEKKFPSTFNKMAREAITYYWIANLLSNKYPYYEHHRCFSLWKEYKAGCLNIFRKYKYKVTERGFNDKFKTTLSKMYYLVPLQTHGDFQILEHSSYRSIEEFIKEVLTSFSKNAQKDKFIVFKHHPVDRGRKNHAKYIKNIAYNLGIKDRVIITWDVHLPTCLKNAIGTIIINSTVGLSSLYHKTPTICLGDAIYDIEGLTTISSIDQFWENYTEVDVELFKKYRRYLINTTQVNSNFYL
ncbi:capsule biosynthesis protein [Arcobacter peruensis]|uniref:capsule biosynthesis protein n=1 Tax=Arcobacter peruensis TaxID=2320140 RepID=UPI000F089D11|nr:capsular biosynthesis protein [Arcobacter peruensis]